SVGGERGIKKPMIGGHGHRHARGRGLISTGHRDLLEQGQLAAVAVHRENIDFLARGIRYVDDRVRRALRHGFPPPDKGARQHERAEPERHRFPARQSYLGHCLLPFTSVAAGEPRAPPFGYIADLIGRRLTILLYSVGTHIVDLYLFLGVSTYGPYLILLPVYGFFVVGIFSGHAIYSQNC